MNQFSEPLEILETLRIEAKTQQQQNQIEKEKLIKQIQDLKIKVQHESSKEDKWTQELIKQKNNEINTLRNQINELQQYKIKYENKMNDEDFLSYQFDHKYQIALKEKDVEIFRLQSKIQEINQQHQNDSRMFLKEINQLKNENQQLRTKIDFMQENILQKEQEIYQREIDKKIFYTQNLQQKERRYIKNQILFQSENLLILQDEMKENKLKRVMISFWREKLRQKQSVKYDQKLQRLTFNTKDIVLKVNKQQNDFSQQISDFLRKIFMESFQISQKQNKNSVLIFTQLLQRNLNQSSELFNIVTDQYDKIHELNIKCDIENNFLLNPENIELNKLDTYNRDFVNDLKEILKQDQGLNVPKIVLFRLIQSLIKYENPINRHRQQLNEKIIQCFNHSLMLQLNKVIYEQKKQLINS